jgi:hypothetical protein
MHSGDVWSVQGLVSRYSISNARATTVMFRLARRETIVRDAMQEGTEPEVSS